MGTHRGPRTVWVISGLVLAVSYPCDTCDFATVRKIRAGRDRRPLRSADLDPANRFRWPSSHEMISGADEAVFTTPRRRPETKIHYQRPQSNNEVRSCWHTSSAYFTAGLAS